LLHQVHNDGSSFRGDVKRFAQPIVAECFGFSMDPDKTNENIEIHNNLIRDKSQGYLHGPRDERVSTLAFLFHTVSLSRLFILLLGERDPLQ
jgi:Domain of unknown function (DUF6532)